MRVKIIGAGISGLTTGIALKQKGFKVQIFEQAEQFKPVGAGIFLANNAMQIYERLGLKSAIEEAGVPIHSLKITESNLSPLSVIDLTYFEKKFGVSNIAIHRGALMKILVQQFDKEEILLNKQLADIDFKENNQLHFQDNSTATGELIIGADGINSNVRKAIFANTKIRKAGQICWRGVCEFSLPEKFKFELNEAWGSGNRFGFGEISPNQVYWFALTNFNEEALHFSKKQITSIFKNYHPLVQDLIKATAPNKIHTDQISDLETIKNWHFKNVCLIGDAAHSTTPNMGQGACQAIEDAYFLAEFLEKENNQNAFQHFQKFRKKKADMIVKNSWMIGKMAHWENPLAVSFRNFLMKMTPDYLGRKQSEGVFEIF